MKNNENISDVEYTENIDNYSTFKKTKSRRDFRYNEKKNDRDDKLTLTGTVDEALPGTWFRIKLSTGDVYILATLNGKLRQNHIQILPGDDVIVEVSPYDTSRGRIVRRK